MKLLLSFFLSMNLLALVDYTEPQGKRVKKSSASKIRKFKRNRGTSKSSRSNLANYLSFDLEYKRIELPSALRTKKADRYNFGAHFATDYHIFLDLNIPYIKHAHQTDEKSGYLANPSVQLGLNWLPVGREIPSLDILAGYTLKSEQGELASSRSATMLGLQAMKDISICKLALAHKIFFPSDPSESNELNIGKIYQFQGELAFAVAANISFSTLASLTTVSKGEGANALAASVKYKSLRPKLDLVIAKGHMLSFATRIPLDDNYGKSELAAVNVIPEIGSVDRNYSLTYSFQY